MDHHKGEESSEMYSPDKQGEYGTAMAASSITVQGLSDALMALDPQVAKVTEVPLPKVEYILQLKVTMADWPGQPRPPPFSWNTGMVMHVLKGDPTLHSLEYVQVYGLGTAYLFFYNKQGRKGLVLEANHPLRAHVGDAFSEWIYRSAHFVVNPIPLEEKPVGGGGSSPPSSPDHCWADSNGFSTASEAVGGWRRCRRGRNEKCLAPTCLDMPILKTIDLNADVMYTIWKFDVEGWLNQYDEASMMPHIYHSLLGYPGKWVCSLEEGQNISTHDLLRQMDTVFGSVGDSDSMIRSLYKIHWKETKSVEEYMIRIHEAVAILH